tara:strand:+ start:457 stop:603 length:147 start_codon:yes stop_codon:yes gene_type:complete
MKESDDKRDLEDVKLFLFVDVVESPSRVNPAPTPDAENTEMLYDSPGK